MSVIRPEHIRNSTLAKRGLKPAAGDHIVKRQKIKLFQDDRGAWYVLTATCSPMKATDFEVSLWLDLQEALRK